MDTVVKYSIYNIGEAAAVDIKLTESGFGADDFEVTGGNLAVQVDRMAPKANNSFVVSSFTQNFRPFSVFPRIFLLMLLCC